MRATPDGALSESTTVLGDWYATLVVLRRVHLALCVSERSLLPVVLPATPAATLHQRLPNAVADVLIALDLPEGVVTREYRAMSEVEPGIGKTANKAVLSTMNQLILDLRYSPVFEVTTFTGAALELAETICGAIGNRTPREITRALMLQGGEMN
jgi:hypothetical protein